jgi:hypothetical protein
MYIQLTQNYRDFDKARILDVSLSNYSDTDRLSFRYQVCKKSGNTYIGLFDKNIMIENQGQIDEIADIVPPSGTKLWDAICSLLLQYLIDEEIELGTLEAE